MNSARSVFSIPAVILSCVVLHTALSETVLDILETFEAVDHSPSESFSFNNDPTDFNIMSNFVLLAGFGNDPFEEEEGGVTVFAPNDDAFARTATDLGLAVSSEEDIYRSIFLLLSRTYNDPITILREMVLFHILPGKMKISIEGGSTDPSTSKLDTILQSRGISRVNMTLVDLNPDLLDPNILYEYSNMEVSRSILHVIDRVLFFTQIVHEEPTEASSEPSPQSSAGETELDTSDGPSLEASVSPGDLFDFETFTTPLAQPTITLVPGTPFFNQKPQDFYSSPPNDPLGYVSISPGNDFPSPGLSSAPLPESQPETTSTSSSPDFPGITEEAESVETVQNTPQPDIIGTPESSSLPAPVSTSEYVSYTPQAYHTAEGISDNNSGVESTQVPVPNLESTNDTPMAPHTSQENSGATQQLDSEIETTEPTYEAYQTPGASFESEFEAAQTAEPDHPIDTLNSVGPFPQPSVFIPIAETTDILTSIEPSGGSMWTPYTEEPTAEPSAEFEDSSCFPSSAFVHLPNGDEISLSQLEAGHEILVTGSRSSIIYLFTHKQTYELHDFVRIESEGNHSITLSEGHYIYANGRLKGAGRVEVGDILQTLDGETVVKAVEWTQDYGLIAPHTLHGDIVVNRVLTSTYTSTVHPLLAHSILWPLRLLVRLGLAKEPLGSLLYNGFPRIFRDVSNP